VPGSEGSEGLIPEGEQEPKSSRPAGWWRRLETWQQLVSILASLAGVVGVLLALGVLEPFDESEPATDGGTVDEDGEIPRFDGLAGHLANSRALLDFLEQNDDQTVQLDVDFPDHLAAEENVFTETVPVEGPGHRLTISSIDLMTECEPGAPLPEENPTVADGCMGVSLSIEGTETEDSRTFIEDGVPAIRGYYVVDVTGALHMGLSPIFLRPLTFEQATGA
jgi:hypothetical protein